MQSEIAKRKLDLLENAEKRHKREEERKVKEEEQKAKEYEMHERKQTFDEWEKIQENIQKLRKDLKGEEDELAKQDIRDDLARLMRKKKQLADLLGL